MALLVRISAARVTLGAYRPNRRSRYPLLDPLNGHKAVELPNQRPVISTVLGHDRSHSKNPGSKRLSTDTQTMSVTGLEDYRVLHEAVDKWHGVAAGFKKLYDAAQLKIAKQHGRTRTGGKPGRPRKQPLPSPPKEVIKITPRKRKRAKLA